MILLLWTCSFISQASSSANGNYSLEERILNSSLPDALVPSNRRWATTWVDFKQNLWLIGGTDSDSNSTSTIHDVWMYDRDLERWLPKFPSDSINHGLTASLFTSGGGVLCGSRNDKLGIYGRTTPLDGSAATSITSASTETHVWVLDLQDTTWTKYLCFAAENATAADHSCPESDQPWVFCDVTNESLVFVPENGSLAWVFDMRDSQWRFLNLSLQQHQLPPDVPALLPHNCSRPIESNDNSVLVCSTADGDPSETNLYVFDVPQLTWNFLGRVPTAFTALHRLEDYILLSLNDTISVYATRPAWKLVNVTIPLGTASFILHLQDHSLYYPREGNYNFTVAYQVQTPYPQHKQTPDYQSDSNQRLSTTPAATRSTEKSTSASHLIIDSLDDIRPIANDDSDAHGAIMFFSASLSMFALGALVLFCRKCVKCPPLPLARRQAHRSHVNNKEHSPVRYSVIPDEINPPPSL